MKKIVKKQWWLLIIIAALIVLLLNIKRKKDAVTFHELLADHAGETAVDCGTFPINETSDPGFACALKAQQANQSFYLEVQQQGIDSEIADGWVAVPNGDILYFQYDSDPSGGGHVGAVVYQYTCTHPTVDRSQIICDDLESAIRIPLK